MPKTLTKAESRIRRHKRVRGKIKGTDARPRLAIFRSNRFISAQIINDDASTTLVAAHGREFPGPLGKQAIAVGKAIAERAVAKGVKTIVFDRAGYAYAAQVKALADAAREGGLSF